MTLPRHPELYGAVVCGNPLLDMKRYHKLLAGASWVAEYGNPELPPDWAFLGKYSPYQNVKPGAKLPPVLFYDDDARRPCASRPRRKDGLKMESDGLRSCLPMRTMEGGYRWRSVTERATRHLPGPQLRRSCGSNADLLAADRCSAMRPAYRPRSRESQDNRASRRSLTGSTVICGKFYWHTRGPYRFAVCNEHDGPARAYGGGFYSGLSRCSPPSTCRKGR